MFKVISIILLSLALAAFVSGCQTGGTATPTVAVYGNQIGNIAYDFNVPDTAGNVVSLSQFAGRPVVIGFWSTG